MTGGIPIFGHLPCVFFSESPAIAEIKASLVFSTKSLSLTVVQPISWLILHASSCFFLILHVLWLESHSSWLDSQLLLIYNPQPSSTIKKQMKSMTQHPSSTISTSCRTEAEQVMKSRSLVLTSFPPRDPFHKSSLPKPLDRYIVSEVPRWYIYRWSRDFKRPPIMGL